MTNVQNIKEAQREYSKAKSQARILARKIERAVLDMPAAANGDWSKVGDAKRLLAELQAIHDRLYHQGEYAA